MQICHGRRRCNLAADANTFGSPCHPNSRMYLKVVYTCGKSIMTYTINTIIEKNGQCVQPCDFNLT